MNAKTLRKLEATVIASFIARYISACSVGKYWYVWAGTAAVSFRPTRTLVLQRAALGAMGVGGAGLVYAMESRVHAGDIELHADKLPFSHYGWNNGFDMGS